MEDNYFTQDFSVMLPLGFPEMVQQVDFAKCNETNSISEGNMEITSGTATSNNKVMTKRWIVLTIISTDLKWCMYESFALRGQGLETAFKVQFLLIIELHIEGSFFPGKIPAVVENFLITFLGFLLSWQNTAESNYGANKKMGNFILVCFPKSIQ